MIFGDDEYEVDVGTAGQVSFDPNSVSSQGPGDIVPASEKLVESPTDWSSLVSGLLSIGRRPTATAPVAQPVPGWVWALPVAAGGLLLLLAASRGGSRTPALAGYRRRRRRR